MLAFSTTYLDKTMPSSLDEGQTAALKKAKMLGAWTEDGGDFRWGAFMSIDNVRDEVVEYVDRCR